MNEGSSLLTLNDFIGVPIVVVFFFLLIRWFAPLYITNSRLLILFYWGIFLRGLGIILSLLFYIYIEKDGDTFTYFRYGKIISKLFSESSLQDSSKIFYLNYSDLPFYLKARLPDYTFFSATFSGNKYMILITAITSFFTFDSYIAISIFFSLWGYFGTWLIFYRLVKIYPALYKYFFFFIICWPSSFFFGSSVIKEPLCMGCIGVLFYLLFDKKNNAFSILKYCILALLFSFILYNVKSYLFISLVIAFLFSFLFSRIRNLESRQLRQYAYILFALILIIPTGYLFLNEKTIISTTFSQQLLRIIFNTTKAQLILGNSTYNLGTIEPTTIGIIKYLLASLNVSLFRPYFFEINKFQLLISGSESLLMLLLFIYTLYKISILRLLHFIKNTPILIFCLFYVVLVGIQIGAISFNYGTLVRYKMPILPFFFSFILILLYKNRTITDHTKLSKNGAKIKVDV